MTRRSDSVASSPTDSTIPSTRNRPGHAGLSPAGAATVSVGWLDWIKYMAVPGVIASLLMLGLHLVMFRQTGPVTIDRTALVQEQQMLGPITRRELITLAWVPFRAGSIEQAFSIYG